MRRTTIIITVVLLSCAFILNGPLGTSAQGQGGRTPGAPPPPPQGGGPGGPNNAATPQINASFTPIASTYKGTGVITVGEGKAIGDQSLTPKCTSSERFVAGLTGTVIAVDGSQWTVPAETNQGLGAVDMYNSCTSRGDNPNYLSQLKTVVVDADGEEITATLFGDNYFELYVNSRFVVRDNITFIPFNSSSVRFKARYPMTIAVKMVDWETHLGLGMEYESYNVGDGGFIASFSNGAMTDEKWKVLPVYLAPLDNPGCVVEDKSGNPDSSACSIKPQCATSNPNSCRALHYKVPTDWTLPNFDDSNWQTATLYKAADVTNDPSYVNYASRFGKAQFIWSRNLKVDNLVLARFTVQAPGK